MVQLEAGSAFWNSSRPIGSQASGLTGRSRAISGIKHAGEEQRTADQKPQRNARQRRAAKPTATRCREASTFQPMPMSLGRPDRTDRQTASAPSPACSAAWENLCCASPPAARPAAAPQPQQRGQQALNELTQPARDGWRGAPDLHRRQDNHFARRVLHADDRLLTLCLLHLMPPR